jgi:glyoxylase-like metal-dependent hydrolase (beta-lactamase superfamily II)
VTVQVVTVTTGALRQNGYVVLDGQGGAVLIDPGGEAEQFRAALDEAGAKPLAILATHGHFDHVGAVQDLVDAYAIPFLVHPADHALVRRANLFGGTFGGGVRVRTPTTTAALEGESAAFGALEIACRHTPGHTPGSLCFEVDGLLFTGDTLLPREHAANKLPGAQPDLLNASLARIRAWNQDLLVHPGHGRSIRLGDLLEKIGGSSADGRD